MTAESKKINRTLIIVVVIFAALVIAGAVIGIMTDHEGFFAVSPTFFICIWPAIISQQKFEKWLAEEKNIVMKREKKRAKTDNKI